MIINKLNLKNFGRFQNEELILKQGINVIYGENESGKSTIHSFLQSMLFGMKRLRGRASRTDTYNKYVPWEYAGWYEGAMTFTCGEKRFRLERNFQKNREEATLFCEIDGELLSVKDGDLDMLLGNISEVVYCNTVSVGQAKSTTQEGLYKELRDYLAEFQGSGDMNFEPEKAVEILKQKRKYQENIQELREKLEKSQNKLEKVSHDLSAIRKQYGQKLSEEIRNSLKDLNFLEVDFAIDFRRGKTYSANGFDEIEYEISTNPGEPRKPFGKVVSGGELSRIMLAIKTILADRDEI